MKLGHGSKILTRQLERSNYLESVHKVRNLKKMNNFLY